MGVGRADMRGRQGAESIFLSWDALVPEQWAVVCGKWRVYCWGSGVMLGELLRGVM